MKIVVCTVLMSYINVFKILFYYFLTYSVCTKVYRERMGINEIFWRFQGKYPFLSRLISKRFFYQEYVCVCTHPWRENYSNEFRRIRNEHITYAIDALRLQQTERIVRPQAELRFFNNSNRYRGNLCYHSFKTKCETVCASPDTVQFSQVSQTVTSNINFYRVQNLRFPLTVKETRTTDFVSSHNLFVCFNLCFLNTFQQCYLQF